MGRISGRNRGGTRQTQQQPTIPKISGPPVKSDGKPMSSEECWNQFIIDTTPQVFNYLPLPRIPEKSRFAAVIVEPRNHPHLEYVIRNTMHFLDQGWALHIFCGQKNQETVRDIASRLPGHVHVHKMNSDNLTLHDYNLLLTSKDFWHQIDSEKIVIFQTDVLLRRKGLAKLILSPSNPGYIGSPWPGGRIGNGGFSFRDKSLMLQVIDRVPYQTVWPEDIYFANAIYTHFSHKMPPTLLGTYFGMETQFSDVSVGAHKIYAYHEPDKVSRFLSSIQYPFRTKWR
jgi:hypothetical protein